MNENLEANVVELLHLLSDGDAEPSDIEEMLPPLLLALTNPVEYLEEYPEDLYLVRHNEKNELEADAAQNLFAATLASALSDFSVSGKKGNENAVGIIEILSDKGFEIEPSTFDSHTTWLDRVAHIDASLKKLHANKTIIALDTGTRHDTSVFIIPFDQQKRVRELLDLFGVRVIG